MENPENDRIALIVGLGNPGPEYERTRHNVGAWWLQSIAEKHQVKFKLESKFKGQVGQIQIGGQGCYLLVPTTFMNQSGHSVQPLTQFYKIPYQSVLVAHDDLDLPVGTIRLKQGGGEGGHNGLRSIANQLGTKDFVRLRIGIGHPGHRDRVLDYVLNKPRLDEEIEIRRGLDRAVDLLSEIIQGDFQKAMQVLHSS